MPGKIMNDADHFVFMEDHEDINLEDFQDIQDMEGPDPEEAPLPKLKPAKFKANFEANQIEAAVWENLFHPPGAFIDGAQLANAPAAHIQNNNIFNEELFIKNALFDNSVLIQKKGLSLFNVFSNGKKIESKFFFRVKQELNLEKLHFPINKSFLYIPSFEQIIEVYLYRISQIMSVNDRFIAVSVTKDGDDIVDTTYIFRCYFEEHQGAVIDSITPLNKSVISVSCHARDIYETLIQKILEDGLTCYAKYYSVAGLEAKMDKKFNFSAIPQEYFKIDDTFHSLLHNFFEDISHKKVNYYETDCI